MTGQPRLCACGCGEAITETMIAVAASRGAEAKYVSALHRLRARGRRKQAAKKSHSTPHLGDTI
jgi:hypothetical protein